MQSRSAQAESYLEQAIDSLRSSGDPRHLWSPADSRYVGGPLEVVSRAGDAGNRRLRFLRASVIFAALAVEAYANGLIEELLTTTEAKALDRLPTVDKLLIGPRLAGMRSGMERGHQPIQALSELIRARNRLVHPRRGEHGAYLQYLDEVDERTYGPKQAGRFILAVAEVIAGLEAECAGRPSMAGVSRLLSEHPDAIDALVVAVGPTIGSVIVEDAQRPPDPLELAQRARAAGG